MHFKWFVAQCPKLFKVHTNLTVAVLKRRSSHTRPKHAQQRSQKKKGNFYRDAAFIRSDGSDFFATNTNLSLMPHLRWYKMGTPSVMHMAARLLLLLSGTGIHCAPVDAYWKGEEQECHLLFRNSNSSAIALPLCMRLINSSCTVTTSVIFKVVITKHI